tara:strand:- start:755 stop:1903 length:1149 start_codon:yes stop_codon:yes gene_type:complete
MSSALRFHKVFPTNKKNQYGQLENIDFDLTFPNRKLVCNSIRIQGRVKVFKQNTTRAEMVDNIFVDNMIGANAFFESYETSTQNKGIVEYCQNMGRYMKMVTTGSNSADDMANISQTCELKSQNLQLSRNVFYGEVNADETLPAVNASNGQSFAIKPLFVLNQVDAGVAGGDVNLDHATLGDITISTRTAKNNLALFGIDADANVNYQLEEVALTFHSLPTDGNQSPLVMRTKQVVRQSIQSDLGAVSVNVPQLTNGVSISMLAQNKQNTVRYNANTLDRPPAVSRVEFLINNTQSDFITYQLESNNEILQNYLMSMSGDRAKINQFRQAELKANEAYGIGANFFSLLDLSKDRFGINLTSQIGATGNPYVLFLYFHGLFLI